MRLILFISFSLLFFSVSLAQEDCAIALRNGQKFYEEGLLEKVPPLLAPCINSGFNKEEKVQAYRLLILTYLFDDKMVEAEVYMEKLLKQEPEYQINDVIDPIEFIQLYESYRTLPIYSLGIFGGVNKTLGMQTEAYGINNVENKKATYSPKGMGVQFGIKANFFVMKNLEFNVNAQYINQKFEYKNALYDFTELTSNESQTLISLPLSFTYDIMTGKYTPYIRLGGSMAYLLNSNTNLVRTYTDGSHTDVAGPSISLTSQRQRWNFGLIGGAGVKYKIPRGSIFLDARYCKGLNNQTIPENRYDNTELLYKYFYVDDDFKVDNIQISVGYNRNFYKPKKKNSK